MDPRFTFKSELWRWDSTKASWYFIRVPLKLSQELKAFNEGPRRGFGSIAVRATIGKTEWKTSVFPEKEGTYLLPIKSKVRQAENIQEDQEIEVHLELQ